MRDRRNGLHDETFERVFPRIHKGALGFAVGVTAGAILWLLTMLHVLTGPRGLPLGLLAQYFYGYNVTWLGALGGFGWAACIGFIGGWLVGLVHNATLDVWLLVVRLRTELSLKRHFLDHLR
jgi:hypothetical protein